MQVVGRKRALLLWGNPHTLMPVATGIPPTSLEKIGCVAPTFIRKRSLRKKVWGFSHNIEFIIIVKPTKGDIDVLRL